MNNQTTKTKSGHWLIEARQERHRIFIKSRRAMIEDIKNDKCTEAETEALLDIFTYTTKNLNVRYVEVSPRKAWYHLEDYATTAQRGIDRFTLMVELKNINGQEQWWGVFKHGKKTLKVIEKVTRKI